MAVGLVLVGGPAAAAPAGHHTVATSSSVMDYYQYYDHYTAHDDCVAVGEDFLTRGADGYECRAKDGGWDLWLIFAT
ncbi:hypothetical protein [Streptomyces sp. ME19-01-6]|uniref:hypothetical protein n=1 Tax=Streptomyces sp. ME19-01-6 TaxID=3028686 RepID=UPI0029B58E8E|nr:hypothetical protein [Streptomyces sp. ME19-01-6]MDX3229019.1 hypothetical protein [Streptomyces sp. ME19-01-6]